MEQYGCKISASYMSENYMNVNIIILTVKLSLYIQSLGAKTKNIIIQRQLKGLQIN